MNSNEIPQATLIDGKGYALKFRKTIAALVPEFVEKAGRAPGLAVVLVGEDPASQVYVRSKDKAVKEAGMVGFAHHLPVDTPQDELLSLINKLNNNDNVDGILVQLPLPDHMDDKAVIAAISPDKDVDGFHVVNAGRLAVGEDAIVPCTPHGSLMLLKDNLGDLTGLDAVVVGRSNIVGKPMAQLLLKENCTVTLAHSKTRNLAEIVKRADIVVAAVGRAAMVKGEWIKDGAVVIDVGINRVHCDITGKNKLVGDVDTQEAARHAKAITPVPGGVGPMTIACLLRNTMIAACRRENITLSQEI